MVLRDEDVILGPLQPVAVDADTHVAGEEYIPSKKHLALDCICILFSHDRKPSWTLWIRWPPLNEEATAALLSGLCAAAGFNAARATG
jgi:hypothetical protein